MMPSFKTPVFFIRVDGDDLLIGKGHLRRMLAIAAALQRKGCGIVFVARRSHAARVCFSRSGVKVRWFSSKAKEAAIARWVLSAAAKRREPALLLLDLRGIDKAVIGLYERSSIAPVVFHDSKIHARFSKDCGITFVDCNRRKDRAYPSALLSPEFLEARKKSRHPSLKKKHPFRLLVSLGGSDPAGGTWKIIRSLSAIASGLELHVILSRHYAHSGPLRRSIEAFPSRIHVHYDVQNMPNLLRTVDAAVVGGGMTKYEIACLGIPGIVLTQNAEQERVAREFCRYSGLFHGGSARVFNARRFFSVFALFRKRLVEIRAMRARLQRCVDGKGVFRVAESLLSLSRN